MQPSDKNLKELKALLDEAEAKVAAAKRILFEQVYQEQAKNFEINEKAGPNTIVEGVFNGEEMIDGVGHKYPVSANYASKSKLVSGDKLKLTISNDGSFVFKQIGPIDRKRVVGKLAETDGRWQINCDGKKYNVLQASVTYFHAKDGDEMTAILPKVGECDWAAIENCLNHQEEA